MGGSIHPPEPILSVVEATRAAIDAAHLPPTSAGAVAVLLRLADAIDGIDEDGLNPAGKLDNVSVPTYLRYCEALGLTGTKGPAGSSAEPSGGGAGGTAGRRQRAAQRRGLSAVS